MTSLLTLVTAMVLMKLSTKEEPGLKEAFALVSLGWLGAAFFGALPYILLGTSLIDGLFESMSAFTTTGSSILTESNAEGYWIINSTLAAGSLAHHIEIGIRGLTANSSLLQISSGTDRSYMGLLFWRSFAQWLGGMGIILLFVAILPRLGVAGRQLYRAEVPGPEKDALTPRIKQTALMQYIRLHGHRRILSPGIEHHGLWKLENRCHNHIILFLGRGELRPALQDAQLRPKSSLQGS
ncbi:MAG: trk system potassium uptake protein TrkH [Methanosaeta sp. ASP1-1]|nr:MAG: trk system potassium uptake protein TrkH [Methanosaeta sp. ASP1-1]